MENIQSLLDGWFRFYEWSGEKTEPRVFEGTLNEFGWFTVYPHFSALLEGLPSFYDDEGDEVDAQMALATEEAFGAFLRTHLHLADESAISYADIHQPIIYSQLHEQYEPFDHVQLLSTIHTQDDVLTYINTTLHDLGHVTHYTGLKPRYEVFDIG